MANEDRDGEWAKRAAAGDRQAFTALVRAHRQWVYRLCWSVTGNHSDADDAAQDPPDPAPTPEEAAAARQEGGRAEGAVASLPSELREAFLLRAVEGLSYKEIAEATGAPLGTVMSRLARAREKVMAALGDEGKGEATR